MSIVDTMRRFNKIDAAHTHGSDGKAQINVFAKGKVTLKVSQITIRYKGIGDSFVPGDSENGKIYDAGKLILFDNDLGGLVFDDPYTNYLDGSMYFWDRDRHI